MVDGGKASLIEIERMFRGTEITVKATGFRARAPATQTGTSFKFGARVWGKNVFVSKVLCLVRRFLARSGGWASCPVGTKKEAGSANRSAALREQTADSQ